MTSHMVTVFKSKVFVCKAVCKLKAGKYARQRELQSKVESHRGFRMSFLRQSTHCMAKYIIVYDQSPKSL